MAEFQEVMKQWRRMCKMFSCSKCPLDEICSSDPQSRTDTEKAMIEEMVMHWAKENPELVYPTWLEFVLCQLASKKPLSDHDLVVWMDNTHIPADIAQKLGIEPKGYIREAERDE